MVFGLASPKVQGLALAVPVATPGWPGNRSRGHGFRCHRWHGASRWRHRDVGFPRARDAGHEMGQRVFVLGVRAAGTCRCRASLGMWGGPVRSVLELVSNAGSVGRVGRRLTQDSMWKSETS
jgi:hypothetical protein